MVQISNDQDRFTAERVARTRPKTYRAIVRLLADPDAKIEHIAQRHRVSTHTVRAIRAREAVAIAERKQRLMSIFANVAEISAERMEELAGQASLRDAGTTAGIATDKLLALSGEPPVTIDHRHYFPTTDDELVEFAVYLSKKRKAIDAEIVTPQLADTQETHLQTKKTPRKKKANEGGERIKTRQCK
jgi:transposase-like protein